LFSASNWMLGAVESRFCFTPSTKERR
jgi:hypothetical protein